MDRQITLQMLDADEEQTDKDHITAFNQHTAIQNSQSNTAAPNSGNKQKSVSTIRPSAQELCAWFPGQTLKPRKAEKHAKPQQKEREFHVWRDYRPKEINFVFKHYIEWQRYIEQYRFEHTYNFGPLSKEMIDLHQVRSAVENVTTLTNRQKRPPPRLRSEGNLQSLSNPASSAPTPRTQSESNI